MEEASVEVMEVVEAMAAVVAEVDMVEVLRLPAMESETPRATGRDTQRRSCAQWTRTPAMWTWTNRWWTRWRRARASRLGYQLIRASDGKSKRSWRANKPPQDIICFKWTRETQPTIFMIIYFCHASMRLYFWKLVSSLALFFGWIKKYGKCSHVGLIAKSMLLGGILYLSFGVV